MSLVNLDQIRRQLNMSKDEFEANEDIQATLTEMIEEADAFIASTVGENFNRDDSKARRLALLIITDWYQDRTLYENKVSAQYKRPVQSLILNLKLETQRKG